jgi:hypothetical protein
MEVARHAAAATVAARHAAAEAADAMVAEAVHGAAVEAAEVAGGAARASAYRLEVSAFVGEEKGGFGRPSLSAKRGEKLTLKALAGPRPKNRLRAQNLVGNFRCCIGGIGGRSASGLPQKMQRSCALRCAGYPRGQPPPHSDDEWRCVRFQPTRLSLEARLRDHA